VVKAIDQHLIVKRFSSEILFLQKRSSKGVFIGEEVKLKKLKKLNVVFMR